VRAITLRIPSSGAHFSDTGRIPWSDTNLPANDFRFSEWTDIYWEVEMLAYNKHTERLQVQVTDFEAGEGSFAPGRKMRSSVEALEFMPLAEEPFKAQSSYYKGGSLNGVLLRKSDADEPALLTDSPVGGIVYLKGLSGEPPCKYSDKRWCTQ
jgi:hypothetical protein